jgi:hypothetical protein
MDKRLKSYCPGVVLGPMLWSWMNINELSSLASWVGIRAMTVTSHGKITGYGTRELLAP